MLEHVIYISALSLIRYCLTPDANNRATTKDILRHEWLANGPVLSLKLNSITPTSIPLTDQQSYKDYDKIPLRTNLPTTYNEKSVSPTSSLVDLELHTSSFFDTTKIHDNNLLKTTEQQQQSQRRNRASVASDSTRYYSSTSRPSDRRPLSLSLDDQYPNNPIDYHFTSTSEKPSLLLTQPQPYIRRSRRTVSPTSTKTTSSYGNNDRMSSSPISYRYSLATSSDIKKPPSPISPSIYPDSYDCDTTLRDFKRKPIFKYTPPIISSTNDLNVVPSLSNSTTPVAPSVFTTSAIKFAPAPIRRMSPTNDQENNINSSLLSTARYLNNTISNPSSNIDDSINTATTNHNNRHALLTSYETNNLRKSRLLDDNNNLISLRVHD
ncbi:unnamed protein product [Rotaria sordida]|uniref:Protein kinase domain-containing protein n=1 Tax=Rotaria sordida TaxID=392033 RepID=A0A813T9Y8_9BILA|nr:unnamed protein product [Rotaria sordida]CAF0826426.1 unnamed protein product [Rotaria sordida]CAF1002337.1 unnamed protein product [Rotaria sordida]CAF1140126.1 unnamed protein product [Rotaria sordida]CAF1144560.1 unnamed protein product [Rotaria sordida]